MNNDNQRNILRCPFCGFTILTKEYLRNCAKDDTPMIYLGLEKDRNKFMFKPKKND